MKNKKLIVQVNESLVERSKKALKKAKKEVLNEKRKSKTINDAFKYYAKTWNDVVHPGLLSIGYEAAGGKNEDLTELQVATLLLTAGFDIHDDIIDESEIKHGLPTVFAKFGKNISLLVGDAFLMKALVLLHKLEKDFSSEKMEAIWDIIDGLFFELGDAEALEASLKNNVDVSAEECLRILRMKSSTFEAHMRIGAIIGGGKPTVINLLSDFGRTMGILINIREDFIDVFEAEELQNRFKNECLPLPIIYAFKNKQTKKKIMHYFSKPKFTNTDAEEIVDIVFEDENVEKFRQKINHMVEKLLDRASKELDKKLFTTLKTFAWGIIEDL